MQVEHDLPAGLLGKLRHRDAVGIERLFGGDGNTLGCVDHRQKRAAIGNRQAIRDFLFRGFCLRRPEMGRALLESRPRHNAG